MALACAPGATQRVRRGARESWHPARDQIGGGKRCCFADDPRDALAGRSTATAIREQIRLRIGRVARALQSVEMGSQLVEDKRGARSTPPLFCGCRTLDMSSA
jgi:hypothetical protein